VFSHGIEVFQTHLSPGDEVIANGTDIGIVQPGEKSPFQTTAATAEAVRGVQLGKDAGEIAPVDKRGRKSAPKGKPAASKKRTAPKAKRTAKAPARKKTAARKATSRKR
jgi:hypothetical protein